MHKLKEKLHLGHSNTATTDASHTTYSSQPATSVARPGDIVQDTTTVTKAKEVTLEKNPKVLNQNTNVEHQTNVLHTQPLVAEKNIKVEQTKSVPIAPAPLTSKVAAPTTIVAPTKVETNTRPVVVQENIHPIQKEEIQPVIHREREQTEIQRMTEHLHETKLAPTLVQEKVLPAEVRATENRSAPLPAFNAPKAAVNIDTTERSQIVHKPIVEETIKKTVIEEVQPVLHRDVVAPTVIKEVKPIYEKIVEPTIVSQVELPPKELGLQQGLGKAPLNSTLTSNTFNKPQSM